MTTDNHLQTRPLTEFEIARLAEVEANESQCNSTGIVFTPASLHEEGRYILGMDRYRLAHQTTFAESAA